MTTPLEASVARRKRPTKKLALAVNRAGLQMLIQEIDELEHRAHRLGLTITARGLNHAKNAAGWELAGNMEAAERATRGLHPGDK